MKEMLMNFKDLNIDYSPSYWSKRYPQHLVVDKHVETVAKASEKVRKSIPCLLNVKYGEKESHIMDIFGTTLPEDSPIFVYIHGGYWQHLSKDLSSYPVEPFFKAGIKVIIPEYELAPKASLEEMIEQIKCMAHTILMEAIRNGARSVWFGGHSAGGHLAISLLDEEWYNKLNASAQQVLKGFILISGIYDLIPILRTEYNEALNLNRSSAILLSPMHKDLMWTTGLQSKLFFILAAAENDPLAFKKQTSDYNEHLRKHGLNTENILMRDLDHFDIVEKLGEETYELTTKIVYHIKNY